MKTVYLGAVIALAFSALCSGQSIASQTRKVIVCTEMDTHALMGVRPLASAIFARIGLTIDWRELNSQASCKGSIRVRLSYDSQLIGSSAERLGSADPCEKAIVLFPERVQEVSPYPGPYAMAHVLAHEIAHVLEGVSRHSSSGIMKARWSQEDFIAMRPPGLAFAEEDVELIYAGLNIGHNRTLTPCEKRELQPAEKTAYR